MIIQLNEEAIKALDAYCMEMPTKFGLPIIQMLQKLAQEQNPVSNEKEQSETVS